MVVLFQLVIVACCPVTLSLWEESASIFCFLSGICWCQYGPPKLSIPGLNRPAPTASSWTARSPAPSHLSGLYGALISVCPKEESLRPRCTLKCISWVRDSGQDPSLDLLVALCLCRLRLGNLHCCPGETAVPWPAWCPLMSAELLLCCHCPGWVVAWDWTLWFGPSKEKKLYLPVGVKESLYFL